MHDKLFTKAKLSILVFFIYLIQSVFAFIYADDSQNVVVTTEKSSSSFRSVQPKSIEPIRRLTAKLIPAAPDFDVKSYILIDADSGDVIAQKNAYKRMAPASLTKVMTLYLIANALHNGQINLDDKVIISEKAWRTGGSRMFVEVGSSVLAKDLIKGIAVASGNDATVAMAEHLAGSESVFVELMNQTAHHLKLNNTSYADSSGLPHDNNYSTAFDLAVLTRNWILNFPEYYPWFKEREMVYNKIKQSNRNRLLWRDTSIDGVKTGHTEDAGYCLISSGERNGMRLISVVMGAKNESMRAKASISLLNYGFRFFETRKLFTANSSLSTQKVFLGKKNKTDLGLKEDLYATLPIGQYKNLKANAVVKGRLKAPVTKGKVYGNLDVLLDNRVIASKPLVALQDNLRANFFFAIFDYVLMLFHK